jgi:hypothetical protein
MAQNAFYLGCAAGGQDRCFVDRVTGGAQRDEFMVAAV